MHQCEDKYCEIRQNIHLLDYNYKIYREKSDESSHSWTELRAHYS